MSSSHVCVDISLDPPGRFIEIFLIAGFKFLLVSLEGQNVPLYLHPKSPLYLLFSILMWNMIFPLVWVSGC